MELIYLGDSVLKNQVMDSRLSANETNIMGSGYSLSDIGGVLIFLNNNIFFATEWEDKPIAAKDVLEALKPKQKPPREETTPQTKAPQTAAPQTAAPQTAPPQTATPRMAAPLKKEPAEGSSESPKAEPKEAPAGKSAEPGAADMETVKKAPLETTVEEITETLSLEEELKIPKYKLPRGWKTVEMFQKPLAAAENGRRRNAANAVGKETVLQPYRRKIPVKI
jgi:hypothetical protein